MYCITELNNTITPSDQPTDWFVIPRDKKVALLEFFNVSQSFLTSEDLKILADLFNGITGSIYWEDCLECHERLCIANPVSWDNFQGTVCSNQSNHVQDCCINTLMGE